MILHSLFRKTISLLYSVTFHDNVSWIGLSGHVRAHVQADLQSTKSFIKELYRKEEALLYKEVLKQQLGYKSLYIVL